MSVLLSTLKAVALPWSEGRWLRRPGTRRMTPEISDRRVHPIDIPIPIDENGSPVTLDPSCWYVCFVPGLQRQWWHPFVHRLNKHVFVIRPDGEGRWLLIESWWNRIMAATLTGEQAERFPPVGRAGFDPAGTREHSRQFEPGARLDDLRRPGRPSPRT